MSTEAIMGICLAGTISVIVICICISSCYHSKYCKEESYDQDNNLSSDDNTWCRSTYFTIPDGLSDEAYVKIIEALLNKLNDGSIGDIRIDGKSISKEDLEKFINKEDK